MDKIVYRELQKKDYKRIAGLIDDAFGFNEFIKDKDFLDLVLQSYLEDCISESSFSKVAEKDGEIIGIILGSAIKDKNLLQLSDNKLNIDRADLKSFINSKEKEMTLKEFAKITDTYEEIIKGKKEDFQGCIQLFIVSRKSRGLGLGKSLLNYLFTYMKSMSVKSLYLYTDTRCNYGFYDSQNFKRINEKEIYFDSLESSLDVFLYSYNFE